MKGQERKLPLQCVTALLSTNIMGSMIIVLKIPSCQFWFVINGTIFKEKTDLNVVLLKFIMSLSYSCLYVHVTVKVQAFNEFRQRGFLLWIPKWNVMSENILPLFMSGSTCPFNLSIPPPYLLPPFYIYLIWWFKFSSSKWDPVHIPYLFISLCREDFSYC